MAENENPSAAMGATSDAADSNNTETASATETAGGAMDAGGGSEGGAATAAETALPEEITYHAVEKDGHVTAIWEMQGRKHLRTIDPRSREGQEILRLFTAEHE